MVDIRLEVNPLWVMSAVTVVLCSIALVVVLYMAQKKDEAAAEKEKRKRKRNALQARDKKRMRKRIQGEDSLEVAVIEGSGNVLGHTLQSETVTVEVGDFKRVTVQDLAKLFAHALKVAEESIDSLSFKRTALCPSSTLANAGVGSGASVYVEYRDVSSAILKDCVRNAPRGCLSFLRSVSVATDDGTSEREAEWTKFCPSGSTSLPGGSKAKDGCPHCRMPRAGTRFVPELSASGMVTGESTSAPVEIHIRLERRVRQLELDAAKFPKTEGVFTVQYLREAPPAAPVSLQGRLSYCGSCGDDDQICFKWAPAKAKGWPLPSSGVLKLSLEERKLPLSKSAPGAAERLATATCDIMAHA